MSATANSEWIGRSEQSSDIIDVLRAQALQACLDDPLPPLGEGDPLPPLWHWTYFWQTAPTEALGADGHAARGEFLPPVSLPRRMWAGSRLRFPATLPIGCEAWRRSEILSIEEKQGRSGKLVFVTVRHLIGHGERLCIEEEHDIVYREKARPGTEAAKLTPAPASPQWARRIRPSPVLLFRYSALTFNGHRIHYDLSFARDHEGYPGLVVHGPLLATLMLDLSRRADPARAIAAFSFRAHSPLFDCDDFTVCGRTEAEGARLWVTGPRGELAMEGRAEFGKATGS